MKKSSLNDKLIEKIEQYFTDKKQIIPYLMDTLCLTKESAYRRVRKRVPFSIDELQRIADDMFWSIDELMSDKQHHKVCFNLDICMDRSPQEIYKNMLEKSAGDIKNLLTLSNLKIYAVINRLPFVYFPFEYLFKLEYCMFLAQHNQLPFGSAYDEIHVPSEINKLKKDCCYHYRLLKNVTCVVDGNLFTYIIQVMRYFYQIRFLSKQNVVELKRELKEFFLFVEQLLRDWKSEYYKAYSIYYTPLNLEANVIYYEWDDGKMTQLWIHEECPIVIRDYQLLQQWQKQWIESKLKHSTLVTNASPILQNQLLDTLCLSIDAIDDLEKEGF